ncbi:MAG: GNAT family N-acetyltransferase [Pseudomonadota bacterium]
MTELQTSRLKLRPARPSDLAALHAVLSDGQAMRFWSTPPHQHIETTSAWLRDMISAPPETSHDFVVEHRGVVIGKAGFYQLPEIGFILHPDYWGQGLAREALQAVIASVFATYPIPQIIADVDPRNAGSLAVLTRLGFMETGRAEQTLLVGDTWCDSIYLGLSRPQP